MLFRSLSSFNKDFERLWEQVQEFESYKNSIQLIREEDLTQINLKFEKIASLVNNTEKNSNHSIKRMEALFKQYDSLTQNMVLYKQSVNTEISGIEIITTNMKNDCDINIESLRNEISRVILFSEQNINKYKELTADIGSMNYQIEGI